MNRMVSLYHDIRCSRWAAAVLAAAGAMAYFFQSIWFAHTIPSILDEGNYLYKGLLFARGIYYPFQPYGPLTNKMPLAFLIPGWVQVLFGPGLRTGRYYAIFLGLLMLLGMWIVARRFSGNWWAAGSILLVAAAPGLVAAYSQVWSEGLVAAMLVWILVLVLGSNRPLWQIIAGSILSGLIVMTRQNMLPVAGLVAGYIFWECGWRKGLISSLAVALVLVVGHALYWPGIWSIWRPWLPFDLPWIASVAPALLGIQIAGQPLQIHLPSLKDFLYSFVFPLLSPLRNHFVAIVGTFTAMVLWPRRKDWPSQTRFRAAVLLLVLMVVLTALHGWGALGHDYCPYCFDTYFAFYVEVGLLLVVVSAPVWKLRLAGLGQAAAVLVTLFFTTAVGYVTYTLLDDLLLTIQIPRVTNMRFLPGSTDLWRSLSNKFGLSYEILQRLIPSVVGLLAGVVILVVGVVLARLWRKRSRQALSFGTLSLGLLLGLGVVLSPTQLMGGQVLQLACRPDILAGYEEVGAHLEKIVPSDALIYWNGGLSPVLLLYLPDVRIFPPQLNSAYSFSKGTRSDQLYRAGFWNQELANQWLQQADYVLMEERVYKRANLKRMDPKKYNELAPTQAINSCRSDSRIRVFRREK